MNEDGLPEWVNGARLRAKNRINKLEINRKLNAIDYDIKELQQKRLDYELILKNGYCHHPESLKYFSAGWQQCGWCMLTSFHWEPTNESQP